MLLCLTLKLYSTPDHVFFLHSQCLYFRFYLIYYKTVRNSTESGVTVSTGSNSLGRLGFPDNRVLESITVIHTAGFCSV